MSIGRKFCVATIALWMGIAARAQVVSELHAEGPMNLYFSLTCPPALRPKLWQTLQNVAQPVFERRKREGSIRDYTILFSRYGNSDDWDAAIIVSFLNNTQADDWKKVEHVEPAGLPADVSSIVTEVHTYPVDETRSSGVRPRRNESVFLVIPYEFEIPLSDYMQYFDDYVVPQLSGWSREGVLTAYQLYTQRYAADRPWTSLLLLQYKDGTSLGRREAIVAKVRGVLKENSQWRALSEAKHALRKEKSAVIADEILSQ